MAKGLALNHLNLPAGDPEGLRRWYADKLGFEAHGRFLWSAGTLLVFVQGDPLPGDKLHFGFRVDSMQDLHDWVKLLRERGVEVPDPEGDPEYCRSYIADPEGNQFEIFFEPIPMLRRPKK